MSLVEKVRPRKRKKKSNLITVSTDRKSEYYYDPANYVPSTDSDDDYVEKISSINYLIEPIATFSSIKYYEVDSNGNELVDSRDKGDFDTFYDCNDSNVLIYDLEEDDEPHEIVRQGEAGSDFEEETWELVPEGREQKPKLAQSTTNTTTTNTFFFRRPPPVRPQLPSATNSSESESESESEDEAKPKNFKEEQEGKGEGDDFLREDDGDSMDVNQVPSYVSHTAMIPPEFLALLRCQPSKSKSLRLRSTARVSPEFNRLNLLVQEQEPRKKSSLQQLSSILTTPFRVISNFLRKMI